MNGERDILGLWAGDGGEGAKFWLSVLTEIKNSGVADVCIVVCDGLQGLPETITTVWERAIVQTRVIHLIRNTFRYASRKYWDHIARDLKPIYTAPTEAAAKERFVEFTAAWGERPTDPEVHHAPLPDRRSRPRPHAGGPAWSYREARWGSVFAGVDPDPANAELIKQWTIDYFTALHPYSAGGAYVNMMMHEGPDRIRASYRDNYHRLAAIKTTYDPDNCFRVNQNIQPAAR